MNGEGPAKGFGGQSHVRTLGQAGPLRRAHLAVGDGRHARHQEKPYVFSRKYEKDGYADQVLVALDAPAGNKSFSPLAYLPTAPRSRIITRGRR
jgi:hypothetical protein